ncbi:MAG TPA: hypothetical protein VKV38_16735 [Trebonia sp.]|jgi:hypothetical protein|nr:hypothetical protein [Trebonia sp.]
MGEHRGAGGVAVAAADRLEDQPVAPVRVAAALLRRVRELPHACRPLIGERQQAHQQRIARCPGEQHVEGDVGLDRLAGRQGPGAARQHALQGMQRRAAGSLGGELGDRRFERLAQLGHVAQRPPGLRQPVAERAGMLGRAEHDGAASRPPLDDVAIGQLVHGLAQRHPGHAQHLGELALRRQLGAGSERTAADERLDVRDDLLAHAHRPPHEGAEPAHPATPVGLTI